MAIDFRFCPPCGTGLQPVESLEDGGLKTRLRCPACGWTHWNNPTPVLAAIIECADQGGKVLLARNAAWTERFFGLITGFFTNGTTSSLARIVLADFNNPSGMLRIGDNMYQESANSGGAVLGFALEGSQSQLTSGALEMSNVDLAQEFTNMIVAQRGFQANGKVVSTSDEMLQELMSIKR